MTKLDEVLAAQAETAAKLDSMASDLGEVGTDLDALIEVVRNGSPDQAVLDQVLSNAISIRDRVSSTADSLKDAAGKFTPDTPAA